MEFFVLKIHIRKKLNGIIRNIDFAIPPHVMIENTVVSPVKNPVSIG